MLGMHLAQVNIARLLYPRTDPRFQSFVDRLAPTNALAEATPGFIWRYLDAYNGDDGVFPVDYLVNISVWEHLDALKNYTYQSAHKLVMKDRKEWFQSVEGAHFAMWWVQIGQHPTIQEAKTKLDILTQEGESPQAFTFRRPFDASGQILVP